MRYMNMDYEKIAKNAVKQLENPDIIRVPVRVSWFNSICLPNENGNHEEVALFKVMTFGDNFIIEKACRYEEEVEGISMTNVDYNEMRRLSLKRNLINWTLNIPIERDDGWLTEKTYERVGRLPAPLVEAFLDGFWKSSEISKEEEERISKQASSLFGKNSRGITDACEAVRLYCTYGSFAEKFNLNGRQVMDLPFREYLMLKMMISHENESLRKNQKMNNNSNTKIAGPGGKVRPSRGTRIEM
jgi:hypothetical protein